MPYDGCVLFSIKDELEKVIVNSKIEKIYQPEQNILILNLRQNKKDCRLLISADPRSARLHLTNMNIDNPISPPTFCMVLRKYLIGGRIIGLSQPKLERIFNIEIETIDELGIVKYRTLIIEIMGKHSNIILVDTKTNKIIDSIKRIPESISSFRQIIPGIIYKEPPYQDKLNPLSRDEKSFIELFKNPAVSKIFNIIVNNYMGISPVLAKHIVESSGFDEDSESCILNNNNIIHLWETFDKTFNIIETSYLKPIIFIDDKKNRFVDFYIFPLVQYGSYNKIEIGDISATADLFYKEKIKKEEISNYKNNLHKTINDMLVKCNKKVGEYKQKIEEVNNKEDYRISGELITANIYRIEKGLSELLVKNYYEAEQPLISIKLDPALTPPQNAQFYFKKYHKLKNSEKIHKKIIADIEDEINYLEGISVSLEDANELEILDEIKQELLNQGYIRPKRKRKKSKENIKLQKEGAPRKFVSSEGFEMLVGKNNKQNEYLTLKLASDHDIWLHTKNIPGSHVIVRTMGRTVDETTIKEAANLAAFYSKAKNSSNVPVDYTEKKNIRKPRSSKPGMVIYENYNTIYITPSWDKTDQLDLNFSN